MSSEDKLTTIVFNGEIYNYKFIKKILKNAGVHFKSNSDTEVLLNSYILWGSNCNEKLKGMFAYAIYNKKERNIFISRDIAGEKPLYYYFKNGHFIFS